MRISLGAALFFVLSGIALLGVGLTYTDAYYIGSGVTVILLGTVAAAILMGRSVEAASEPQTVIATMKKNKSDSNLELMGRMEEAA